jgi:hypothetical protein
MTFILFAFFRYLFFRLLRIWTDTDTLGYFSFFFFFFSV